MCERLEYENKYYQLGYSVIAGVDEAGRGPLAGPVVCGACVFEKGFYDERINDSKQLSEKKREILYDLILKKALAYSVVIVEPKEIDEINIYEASRQGMIRALKKLTIQPDFVLSDAMNLKDSYKHEAIIKGDAKSMSIGAASILAKVTRDRLMKEYALKYPGYGFEKHKGYPTKAHIEAIKNLGLTPIHRLTYGPCQKVLQKQLSFDLFDE